MSAYGRRASIAGLRPDVRFCPLPDIGPHLFAVAKSVSPTIKALVRGRTMLPPEPGARHASTGVHKDFRRHRARVAARRTRATASDAGRGLPEQLTAK